MIALKEILLSFPNHLGQNSHQDLRDHQVRTLVPWTFSDKLTNPLDGVDGVTDRPRNSYLAIAPRTPLQTEISDATWIVVRVRVDESPPQRETSEQATIRLSSQTAACQTFLNAYAAVDHNRHASHVPKSIEIRAVSTRPLALDTVYVTVERGLIEKVDDIQGRFGGGFHHEGRNWKVEKTPQARTASPHTAQHSKSDRMTGLVRDALSKLSVVHCGDVFPLPLPAHPITHVRPPPAIVVECEPVSQGIITGKTKVVVVQAGSSQEKALKRLAPPRSIIEESVEDTADDTTNDQFYSAAEDRLTDTGSEMDDLSEGDTATDESVREESEDDSDSMDDMISLSAPGLPPQPAGTLSAMTAATPRPGMTKAGGTQTPGSVYSSFTAATARADSRPGKVFRTEALLQRIPLELLHPRPGPADDDDSFVFVDTSTLAKIGCFSGDWVRIEVSRNMGMRGFPTFNTTSLHSCDGGDEPDWRAVKVFGLSGLPDEKVRYVVDKSGDQRSLSQRDHFFPVTPSIYLSPPLLANLSNAEFVKVGALPRPQRYDARAGQVRRSLATKNPPTAREVTLLKIATPLTTSREMQSTLFSGLKNYFESKRRMLKKGDLIAIPVDQDLAKATASLSGSNANVTDGEFAFKLASARKGYRRQIATAWFSVQYIEGESSSDLEDEREQQAWGGVALVDSAGTRLSQAGNLSLSVSESIELWTKYWLGTSALPRYHHRQQQVVITAADLPIPEKMSLEKRLADLVSVATSSRAVNLGLPPLVILLHSTQRQIGKTYVATSACSAAGIHTFTISGHDLLSENASNTGGGDVKTEALLKARAERALSCGARRTALLIQHIDVLTADRMVPAFQEIVATSRVLIATTSKIDDVPSGIRSLFTHELAVTAPNEAAREVILRNACLATAIPLSANVSLKSVALQTAALVAGDLIDVVDRACIARSARLLSLAEAQNCHVSDIVVAGGQSTTHFLAADFTVAISAARSTFSDAIGAPKIPTVTWSDVGGLSSQKDAIMETISLPLSRPELFANGIRKRSGILFYGPPGTGKTLLAKAIATEFSLNFFSVKGPELLNMYIGESEANVRRVFQRARDARPCVVFFDELDSVAPKRGNQGDSGGVMDRIVSQLLAELDGMSSGGSSEEGKDGPSANAAGGVFVIGATNRPDLLDPALLRPGRFDKMLYLGVADTHDQQVTILKALTRKFTLASDVDLHRIAAGLPFTYTGADLYALCSDAMLKAITRKTKAVDEKVRLISHSRGEEISTSYFFDHLAEEDDLAVVVNEDDFRDAQRELVGSVSQKELEHFERIRRLFEDMDIGTGAGAGDAKKGGEREKKDKDGRQQFYADPPSLLSTARRTSNNSTTKGKGKAKRIEDDDDTGTHGFATSDYGVGIGDSDTGYASANGSAMYRSLPGPNESMDGSRWKGKGKGKGKAIHRDSGTLDLDDHDDEERDDGDDRIEVDGFKHDINGEGDEELYA